MTRSLLPTIFGGNKKPRPVFQSLQNEIDRVFEDFRGTFEDFGEKFELQQNGMLTPKINVSESESAIDISCELPGVKEENIDVTVSDKTVIIKGEKSEEREEKEKDYHLVERSYGSYMRSIPLGFEVDGDKVEATVNDGVLNVSIKKPAEIADKTKKIPISKAA